MDVILDEWVSAVPFQSGDVKKVFYFLHKPGGRGKKQPAAVWLGPYPSSVGSISDKKGTENNAHFNLQLSKSCTVVKKTEVSYISRRRGQCVEIKLSYSVFNHAFWGNIC